MKEKSHFDGRTMHIDVSKRFYQKGDSGVAFKIISTNEHKGIILSNKLKKGLKKNLKIEKDYARLYAICIYYLIRDDLDSLDNLVICNDELYEDTKNYLDLLFQGNSKYSYKFITSLSELRRIAGDNKVRSYADNIANIYRKKASKSLRRKQKGIQLNIVNINFQKIKEKWEEISKKIK